MLRLSRKIILTSLMNMSLVLRLPREMHLCRFFFKSSNVHACPNVLKLLQNPHVLLTLARYRIPCAYHAKSHPETVIFYHLLTSTCASRHKRCAIFQHLNFQKVLRDFEICFAPQLPCNFSSLIWPDGSAPAALASLLFDPPEPQDIGKKCSVSRLFYLFAPLHSSFF